MWTQKKKKIINLQNANYVVLFDFLHVTYVTSKVKDLKIVINCKQILAAVSVSHRIFNF